MRALWLASTLSLVLATWAAVTVIDDQNGDPTNGRKITYSGLWSSGNIGTCGDGCLLPNPASAYEGTFTGAVAGGNNNQRHPPTANATVSFFGTSVSVQCFLSDSLENPRGRTDMRFFIDGALANSFSHEPIGTGEYSSQIVFTARNLSLGLHTLVIQNGVSGSGHSSLAILDSVSYSADEDVGTGSILGGTLASGAAEPVPSPSATNESPRVSPSAKSSNTAPIVGAVVGVLAVLLLLLLAFLYIRQRRKQHKSNVPLSTTLFSPFRDLWSAARGSAKPQPDMAPVPFPTPTHALPAVVAPSPPAAVARPRPRHSAPAAPSSSRISRISFNPNLLVGRIRRQAPPPITTQPDPRAATASPAIPSGNPLIRQTSSPAECFASIQAWQQQTREATANDAPPIHPLDMSEVDLSSHYDESSSSPPPAPPPPVAVPRSPQPQRRFTVMNN